MSLLQEIQEAATGSITPLVDLLRKCRILAARLKHEPLEVWVRLELNGYPQDAELPAYRKVPCDVLCSLINAAWRANSMVVPESVFPDKDRSNLTEVSLYQGVAELEELVNSKGELAIAIDPAYAAHHFGKAFPQFNVTGAWRSISPVSLKGVVETIRSKVLDFALEIEAENPDAGERAAGELPVSRERLTQIFNMTITDAGSVAVGSAGFTQTAIQVRQGEWSSLVGALKTLGVPEENLGELREVLEADSAAPREVGEFGPGAQRWLGKLGSAVATGAVQLATAEGLKLVGQAILMFLDGSVSGSSAPFVVA